MRLKILVLGCDDLSGLAVVRSLGRAGYEVHIGWLAERTVIASSRYVARFHDVPAPTGTSREWIDALIGLVEEHRFDLVLPCSDMAMAAVHKNRGELAAFGRFYCLSNLAF